MTASWRSDTLYAMNLEDATILNARIATVLIDRNEMGDPKKREKVIAAIEDIIRNYKSVVAENTELKKRELTH